MPANYQIKIFTSDGVALAEMQDLSRWKYSRTLNQIGWFQITADPNIDPVLLEPDRLFEFWRRPEGGENQLEIVGFLRYWEWMEGRDGKEILRLGGPDQVELLDRRVIAYRAGTSEADKNDAADDMMKEIVDENMGPSAPVDEAGRPRRYPAGNFTIMANTSEGPTLDRRFAWRRVLRVLQSLADASEDQGTPLFFDCVPGNTPATFEFRTWINQPGMDRTLTAGLSPIVFSKESGNLAEPLLRFDWTEEANYVWGGGQGEESARTIDPEDDPLRMHRSIWNRREVFEDAREHPTTLGVANKAFARMERGRPVILFDAQIVDSPVALYGKDWFFGDRATARHRGMDIDGLIKTITVEADVNGEEIIAARFGAEIATG